MERRCAAYRSGILCRLNSCVRNRRATVNGWIGRAAERQYAAKRGRKNGQSRGISLVP